MKIAVIGCRHDHIYAVPKWAAETPEAELVAAWEPDAAAAAKAEGNGIPITHSDLDALLQEPEIELVVIGDYYAARGPEILKALEAGKHVMTDKPACIDRETLYRIQNLSREKGLTVSVMLDMRLKAAFRTAVELIQEGVLGEVHNAVITGTHPLMWGTRPMWYFEEGKHGGTINDIAVHGVDMLRILTGKRLSRVIGARTWNGYAKEAPDFKDCAQFLYELEGGFGVAGDVSYSAPPWASFPMPQYWRTTVWGEKGVLEFDVSDKPVELILHGKEPEYVLREYPATNPLIETLRAIRGEASLMEGAGAFASSEDTLKIQEAADGIG